MTKGDTIESVSERAISVRLDSEAEKALTELMRNGRSQSEAIRSALLLAADRDSRERLRQEVATLAADPSEQKEIAALREELFGER
jgi:Arc/MetJ-type ribon-helix-helix transcriptional regulator